MKRFKVYLSELYLGDFEIEAETKDDAWEKMDAMLHGEGDEDIPGGIMNFSEGYKVEDIEEIK
jgi:hypothetical protein